MSRILYLPAFPNLCTLADQLVQIIWHLQGSSEHVDALILPCFFPPPACGKEDAAVLLSGLACDDIDPAAFALLHDWMAKIQLVAVERHDPLGLLDQFQPGRVILWQPFDGAARVAATAASRGCRHYALDRMLIQNSEGGALESSLVPASQLLALAWQLEPDRISWIRQAEARFARLIGRYGQGRHVRLFGNGPSLEQALAGHGGRDGALIVHCNNIVLNRSFMERAPPDFIVVYDDELWSCRSWSARFRRAVKEVMARPEVVLVIPMMVMPLVLELLGRDLEDRMLGIPYSWEPRLSNDLFEKFQLNATNNVLTAAMLPVAHAFAAGGGMIDILGCDGRPFDLVATDWPHSPGVQNPDRLRMEQASRRNVSPYDYREVVLHYLWTEQRIAAIEAAGIAVRSLTPSYNPALALRFAHA